MRSSKITFKCDRCWREEIFVGEDSTVKVREQALHSAGWTRVTVGVVSENWEMARGQEGTKVFSYDLCSYCTSKFSGFIDGATLALATDRLGGEASVPQPDPTLSQSTETKV